MSLLSGLEQLIGVKKKQPQQQKQAPRQQQAPPDITYNPNPATNIPFSTHVPITNHPIAQPVQGYPGEPDDADAFGGAAMAPQMTVAPQYAVQPTLRPYQVQNNRPADTVQYGNSPQLGNTTQLLQLRRRLLGL